MRILRLIVLGGSMAMLSATTPTKADVFTQNQITCGYNRYVYLGEASGDFFRTPSGEVYFQYVPTKRVTVSPECVAKIEKLGITIKAAPF